MPDRAVLAVVTHQHIDANHLADVSVRAFECTTDNHGYIALLALHCFFIQETHSVACMFSFTGSQNTGIDSVRPRVG